MFWCILFLEFFLYIFCLGTEQMKIGSLYFIPTNRFTLSLPTGLNLSTNFSSRQIYCIYCKELLNYAIFFNRKQKFKLITIGGLGPPPVVFLKSKTTYIITLKPFNFFNFIVSLRTNKYNM